MTVGSTAERIHEEIERVIVGQSEAVELLTVALLARGHVLLEGIPGVAKTTLAESFASASGLDRSRIQLTPDLIPADITGTTVFREDSRTFEFQQGPVFANLVIADEINRATPNAQSALLEAMQERSVTVDGTAHDLPRPFMVVATQNPVEMEGTYELPRAQRDRFLFEVSLGPPTADEERAMLDRFDDRPELGPSAVETVVSADEIDDLRAAVDAVTVAPAIREYIVDLAVATRESPDLSIGLSPRAALQWQWATKARAAVHDREYVLPDDVKALAVPIARHRIHLDRDAALADRSIDDVLDEMLDSVPTPDAAGPDGS
ncbi:AAA family ATPase [Halococcoides cellulosivorans]|uniref:Magnesium chelatase n=1 Tax=Halococcoides cellulosivorans TaxID=1679096 RepID=A0A2R4X446_9EURY|nr:MoxR family ATPase [Halococcoides cellulosivorans]AWB28557.1 magnesium chelatase [Halococcoides cellulosivorans]